MAMIEVVTPPREEERPEYPATAIHSHPEGAGEGAVRDVPGWRRAAGTFASCCKRDQWSLKACNDFIQSREFLPANSAGSEPERGMEEAKNERISKFNGCWSEVLGE